MDAIPIENGLQEKDSILPLLFNFPSEYVIR